MSFTQANRLISLDTPLGKDVLLLQSFTGRESISRLFSFQLDVLSEQNSISFNSIIGQKVTLCVNLHDGTSNRYFNGYVSRFAQSGADQRFTHYQMEVVPWLWFLTRNADCRIFQNKTIPQIIQQVFTDRGFTDFTCSLTGNYAPREYSVQYRETDFNFVSRLMEQYGIFYFFQHEEGKHTLVLADSPTVYQPCPRQAVAHYSLAPNQLDSEDVVTGWHVEQELLTGKYSVTDYNFEIPSTSLMASEPTVVEVGGNSKFEFYDYPGDHLSQSEGSSVAKIRMEEEEASHLIVSGSSLCRAFTTGYKFELQDHYRDDMNDAYVLTEVQHVASTGGTYTLDEPATAEHYSNHFTCIPANLQFRPARITPKPFVQGPQTALVVGKQGEEIWVDKYGRIKVQFYWDRVGEEDENSSCWMRVSQPWAGGNWGGMWIPRMGQEVIVSFLEGDPDRPIVTGRVYNADQLPPYALPDHQTVSTFKSRSSKGGGSSNYNEIRFEDKSGSEQIFINAERDLDQRVEKECREFVGASRHLIVTSDQLEQVKGSKHLRVGKDHVEKIEGAMSLQVYGDQKEKVGGGYSLQVGEAVNEKVGSKMAVDAGEEIHLKGGMKVIIEAGVQVTLKGGGGFVDVGPSGVTIQGNMVLINSGGAAGSGSGASPQSPDSPKDPDTADDGKKFGKS